MMRINHCVGIHCPPVYQTEQYIKKQLVRSVVKKYCKSILKEIKQISLFIQDCFGFVLLYSRIGIKRLYQPLNQSNSNFKPIATCLSLTFSLAFCDIILFLPNDWLLRLRWF